MEWYIFFGIISVIVVWALIIDDEWGAFLPKIGRGERSKTATQGYVDKELREVRYLVYNLPKPTPECNHKFDSSLPSKIIEQANQEDDEWGVNPKKRRIKFGYCKYCGVRYVQKQDLI